MKDIDWGNVLKFMVIYVFNALAFVVGFHYGAKLGLLGG